MTKMLKASELIDAYMSGESIDILDNGNFQDNRDVEIHTEMIRTARRPKKRRFGRRGKNVSSLTGKRKDPRRRMIARKAARRHKAARRMAARKFARSAKGKQFHKKLGRLVARIRRH